MKESSIWGPDVEWTEQGGGERANHGRLGAVKSSSITHAAPLPRLEFVRKHWLDTQPCGTPLSLHAARMKSPVPVLISFTWKNILHRCWFQEFPGIHNVEDELLVHSGAKEPVRAPPGVLLSPHSPPPPPQELTARYCGVRPPRPVRFPQVAVLSCCICCASCCWRRLCSLSFWVSANFTTIGEEQPCGQTQRKVERGLQPGPLRSGHSVSAGPSFLNYSGAQGMVWPRF